MYRTGREQTWIQSRERGYRSARTCRFFREQGGALLRLPNVWKWWSVDAAPAGKSSSLTAAKALFVARGVEADALRSDRLPTISTRSPLIGYVSVEGISYA